MTTKIIEGPPEVITGHTRYCHLSYDETVVAIGCANGNLELWKNFELKKYWQGHAGHISCIQFSQKDEFFVSGSYDGKLKLWNCENGKLLNTLIGHVSYVYCCCLSKDGNYIAKSLLLKQYLNFISQYSSLPRLCTPIVNNSRPP